jgi:hypothetical protein
MLFQFPSGRHSPCYLLLPPHANWLLDRAVSVVYIHTDRKSFYLASLSTRFLRLMPRTMARTLIRQLVRKLMVALRTSCISARKRRLRVNASMRSRALPLAPGDPQVSVMHPVRGLVWFT